MENQLAFELKKKKVLKDYKSAVISAINLILDNIQERKELLANNIDSEDKKNKAIEDCEKSISRYVSLKEKVEKDIELTKVDYSLLSIVCTGASNQMATSAQMLIDSADQLRNLAKAFFG